MKDLKELYKSDGYKSDHYAVEVVADDLYNWKITMLKMPADSKLAQDLVKLSEETGRKVNVQLEFLFDAKYPFSPPFIRIVAPHISGGYVTFGGGLCMELLTNEGWSSAYSIESLLIQISATLVYGGARAVSEYGVRYTLGDAQRGFQDAAKIHKKYGW